MFLECSVLQTRLLEPYGIPYCTVLFLVCLFAVICHKVAVHQPLSKPPQLRNFIHDSHPLNIEANYFVASSEARASMVNPIESSPMKQTE